MEPLHVATGTTSEKVKHWGLGDVLAGFAASVAFTLAAAAITVVVDLDEDVDSILMLCATFAGMLGWVFAATYRKGSRSVRDDFGWAFRGSDVIRGVGAALGTLVLIATLGSVLWTKTAPDPTIPALQPTGLWRFLLLAVVAVVVAPIAEELFFRGLFLRSAERRVGKVGAVVLTSVVFALLHVPQRSELGFAIAFVPVLVIGSALGWLAMSTRRLGPSVIAHMTFNALAAGVWASRL